MSRLILFFQSKVVLAIIGTVLFGGTAALLAGGAFTGPGTQPTAQQPQTYANISSSGTSTSTALTATATVTPGISPTATPTPRQPTPTPTTPSEQATTLHGTVTSVNTSSSLFTVRISGGATKTVTVQPQTIFQGACTSLSGMQTGWHVTVRGIYQTDGSFAASNVTSSMDD